MKYLTALTSLLLLAAGHASADNFQIVFSENNSSAYIAYSSVRILDGNNRQVFTGSTDKYGRIIVNNLPNGGYKMEVSFRNRKCRKIISIDHSAAFKTINFTPAELATSGLFSSSGPAPLLAAAEPVILLWHCLSFHQHFDPRF